MKWIRKIGFVTNEPASGRIPDRTHKRRPCAVEARVHVAFLDPENRGLVNGRRGRQFGSAHAGGFARRFERGCIQGVDHAPD